MLVKVFKILFPKSILASFHTTKNNSVILKICNQLDIEQVGMYTVRLRHKDRIAKCRLFILPGHGLALL